MASLVMVDNETKHSASRITKEGRKITYQMKVIQQPERARACGSGAKSSADRRPVDPPPIVELRVYEGETMNDITFSYSANFFLFATLENARTLAQGRVAQTSSSFPVLTGTPVAGMAYLDRPSQAGYFIFPDLSVRHEGKYRLSFALYEELKEQKDMDTEEAAPTEGANPHIQAHVSHRLEVKSAPFTVFSAKKFPGLTESTALSRMVAEQGCRVRIRRDVRMRRRDNKTSKDWDDYEEETAYDRARRTATPDAYGQSMSTPQPLIDGVDRPRSVSNASNASFQMPPQRRPSLQDMAQGYQQSYQNHMQGPQPQQNGYSPMPYGAAPQPQQYQGQYAQPQQPMMQPPQAQYQPAHNGYQPHPPMQAPQAYGYQQYPQQSYEQHAPMRHDNMDYSSQNPDYRRQAAPQSQPQQYHTPTQMHAPYHSMDPYGRLGQPGHAVQSVQSSLPSQPAPPTPTSSHGVNGQSLAPLKTLQLPGEKHEPVSPSYSMQGHIPPADTMPGQTYPDPSRPGLAKYATPQPQPTGSKRSYSSTFGNGHTEQPLRQGARPSSVHDEFGVGHAEDVHEDDGFAERANMMYRRADGTKRSRFVPLSS